MDFVKIPLERAMGKEWVSALTELAKDAGSTPHNGSEKN
jgi:hypothetical protein